MLHRTSHQLSVVSCAVTAHGCRTTLAVLAVLLTGSVWLIDPIVAAEPACGGQAPCAAAPAHGQNFFEHWRYCWDEFELSRQRSNAWPYPFVMQDRELVKVPFRLMADNGWKQQTTLSDHLFTTEENQLTYAGELKLRWILTEIPPHRRRIFVKEGHTREETGARIASVYQQLAKISPAGYPCPVLTTTIAPRGGEGSYLNAVDASYKQATPVPRLTAGGSGGSGEVSTSDFSGGS